jgi:hypothetical protein
MFIFQKWGPPTARVIACARPLYLDHIGTQVGQSLGAPRTRKDAGEVKDTNAV